VTIRDNDIGFLRFFRHINFQSSSKLSFFSCQKACQTNNFSLRTTRTSQRASHTNKKNLMMLPLIWRLQWKYFQGSVYMARTVLHPCPPEVQLVPGKASPCTTEVLYSQPHLYYYIPVLQRFSVFLVQPAPVPQRYYTASPTSTTTSLSSRGSACSLYSQPLSYRGIIQPAPSLQLHGC
jgi:hypothetical protein